MSLVGLFGIALGFLAFRWFTLSQSNTKIALLLEILFIHVITATIYYQYVQNNDSDTKLYYFDLYGFYYEKFSLGTIFLVYLVQWLKQFMGGTYLDYFLLFQAVGVWGIALLFRTIEELALALDRPWPPQLTVIMFMPGMYFWTSAIGKDAPLFFACSLAVWSTMAMSRRWLWFGLAVAIMVLFRPHIALIATAALALSVVTGRGVNPALRVLLLVFASAAMVVLFDTVRSSLQLDISSLGSVADFVESQSTTLATAAGEGGVLGALPFPLKLISLLYRPFFFDSGGFFGLVASIQNVFMLYATYILVRENRSWRAMFSQSLPIRFATIFLGAIIIMLSIMYYNVGLGLRQREMFTPALYLIFAALLLMRQRQKDWNSQAEGQQLPSFRMPELAEDRQSQTAPRSSPFYP